ncbi:hypothetical protein AA313_de0206319 [Arthrobotrys entomopaga]|nr:hypothetical protein AA313_de0206319 [Arthrobotrys entomopaga]
MDERNIPLPSSPPLSPIQSNDDKENNPPSVSKPSSSASSSSGRKLRRSAGRIPSFLSKGSNVNISDIHIVEEGTKTDGKQERHTKFQKAEGLQSGINLHDRENEEDVEVEEEEEGDDDFPFVGLSHQEALKLRETANWKNWDKNSISVGDLRRRRFGGRVEILRDAVDQALNTDHDPVVNKGNVKVGWLGKRFGGGKNVGVGGNRRTFEVWRDEEDDDEQVENAASEVEEEDENIPSQSRLKGENDDEMQVDTEDEESERDELQNEFETISPLKDDINEEEGEHSDIENDTESSESDTNLHFIRTDNIALRSKLHPPEVSTLRSTHLQDISIHKEWTARKARLAARYPDEISLDPSSSIPPRTYYSPPPKRRNRKINKMAYPAINLFRHLGLLHDKPEEEEEEEHETAEVNQKDIYRWMRKQDDLLMEQVSLVAARLQFPHIKYIHTNIYLPLRPMVLDYIRTRYPTSSHCLFFSEFTFFNERWIERNRGCCLFLMINTYDTTTVKKEIERLLHTIRRDDELAVIVRKGNPRLFGTYGLPRSPPGETTANSEQTARSNTRGTWDAIKRAMSKTARYSQAVSPETDRIRRGRSWTPEQTPERGQQFKGLTERSNEDSNWKDLQAFHYGLRWVTAIHGIPSCVEGVNGGYQERPDIGASIGSIKYSASGTLSGYLTDPYGEVYAMSCHHVLNFDSEQSSFAFRTNKLKDEIAISPSNPDLRARTLARAHEIDGLLHEAVRAKVHGNYTAARATANEGRKKMKEHDRLAEMCALDGAKYAKVVGSGWRIMHFRDGPWIMDQILMKPHPDRIGTNTFTYTGRDNKEGKRYRLEARGWTDLHAGDEVLKIGRTTGLTKGYVVSTNADFRLCLGDTGPSSSEPTGVSRYWDIQTGVITSGAGPWFSESGDSGAWILKPPKFGEMLRWDVRRGGGESVYDPIAAPVGGMMFAGADSVDGFSLTFYNPTRVMREYLSMMVKGGEYLVPGVGEEMTDPPPLDGFLEEAYNWATQDEKAMDEFQSFIEEEYWDYQFGKYPEEHMFRDHWFAGGKGKGGEAPDANPEADINNQVVEKKKSASKPAIRAMVGKNGFRLASEEEGGDGGPSTRLAKTPRKGTSEAAPDTPVRSLTANLKGTMVFPAESSKMQREDIRVRSPTPNRMQQKYKMVSPSEQRVRHAIAKIENKSTSKRSSE